MSEATKIDPDYTREAAPGLHIGDVVEAVPPFVLRSGSGQYAEAVVVSVEPLALSSIEGDMLWTATVTPEKVRKTRQASFPEMLRPLGRYAAESLQVQRGARIATVAKLVQRATAAEAELATMKERADRAEQRLEENTDGMIAARDSHAKLCRGIKAALGYDNWPDIEGNFADGVIRLLTERITAAQAAQQAAERERDELERIRKHAVRIYEVNEAFLWKLVDLFQPGVRGVSPLHFLEERITAAEAQATTLRTLLDRAVRIMQFHAGRCPMNIPNNYSGCEEHLAEYRQVIKDHAALTKPPGA